jgi:hypothetical protein
MRRNLPLATIVLPTHNMFIASLRIVIVSSDRPDFGVLPMGISNPEIQKKVFGPRWQHEIDKQGWPLWKKLIHRLQRCPICKPTSQAPKAQ